MNFWHNFLPCIFSAVLFAALSFLPISGFAKIEDAKTTAEAVTEYNNEVKALLDSAGSQVSEKFKEEIRSAAASNVSEMDSANANTEAKSDDPQVQDLEAEAKEAKEKEQSSANKMLGGLTMAATGIGGMQLMQGMAEKKADEAGAADMAAYLQTIKCGIGGMQNIPYNGVGRSPADTRELGDARLKYLTIAEKTKLAKENLGLPPGIEAELVIETAALYDGSGMDTDGIIDHFDTATERADSDSGKKRMIAGGVALGAGVLGGVVGNGLINGDGPLGGVMTSLKEKFTGKNAGEASVGAGLAAAGSDGKELTQGEIKYGKELLATADGKDQARKFAKENPTTVNNYINKNKDLAKKMGIDDASDIVILSNPAFDDKLKKIDESDGKADEKKSDSGGGFDLGSIADSGMVQGMASKELSN